MLQAVALFLLVILLLGGFGKLRRWLGGPAKDQRSLKRPRKCPRCGRFLLGQGGCTCGKD